MPDSPTATLPISAPREATKGDASERRARWLTVAHIGWIVAICFDVASFVPGALLYDALVHIPCATAEANQGACATGQLTASAMRQLHQLGISLDLYAAFALVLVLAASVIFFATGALIAWRKWRDGTGLFASFVLITFGTNGISNALSSAESTMLPHLNPTLANILAPFGLVSSIMIWPALGIFLLTFPTGRFVPRWTWFLVGLWITNLLSFVLAPPAAVTYISIALTFGSVLAVQLYRYRRIYGLVERQQTKWLVFSIAVAISFIVALTVLEIVVPSLGSYNSVFYFIADIISASLFFLPIAVAVAIALLRYRLYDIDLIINRALVYGSLTALLAALYAGLILVLEGLVGLIGNADAQRPLVLVISTLAIAALFQPLRVRLQRGIDRRFFRAKYDTARTLAAFGAALRQDVDLAELRAHLVGVVEETMQPTHVSLWLRRPGPER